MFIVERLIVVAAFIQIDPILIIRLSFFLFDRLKLRDAALNSYDHIFMVGIAIEAATVLLSHSDTIIIGLGEITRLEETAADRLNPNNVPDRPAQ